MAKRSQELDIVIAAQDQTAAGFGSVSNELQRFRAQFGKTTFDINKGFESNADALRRDIERRAGVVDESAFTTIGEANTLVLQKQASLGDAIALKTLRQLQLESRQADERRSLVELSKDNLATEEERASAQASLTALTVLHQRELEKVNSTIERGGSLMRTFGRAAVLGFAAKSVEALTAELVAARDAGAGFAETVQNVSHSTAGAIPIAGHFHRIGQNIREMFTGERAELDKLGKSTERYTEMLQRNSQLLRENREEVRLTRNNMIDLEDELANMAVSRDRREQNELNQRERRDIGAIKARLEAQQKRDLLIGGVKSEKTIAIEDELALRTAVALERQSQLFQRQFEDNSRLSQERQRQTDVYVESLERAGKAMDDEMANRRDMEASVNSEILQSRLELEGKSLEAAKEAIREQFRQRIQSAREAHSFELAQQLELLRDLRLRQQQPEPQRRDFRAALDVQRFAQGFTGGQQRNTIEDKQLGELKAQTKLSGETIKAIKDLAAALKQGEPLAAW